MASPAVEYVKGSFSGGINTVTDSTMLGEDELARAFNVRTRYGKIAPIKKPVKLDLPEEGLVQGVYGADNYLIAFINGRAYYRILSAEGSAFVQVAGFQLSETALVIYAELVPASSMNLGRKLTNADANSAIKFTTQGDGTPRVLVAQDGENQPYLINPDATAAPAQVYNDWTQDAREYVPVGKQMMYLNGILYIVSSDGLQIYRSVTGRPLDFMVIIDANGDKLPTEAEGGASGVSFAFSYDPVTCISPLASQPGAFYGSTAASSFIVQPNTSSLVYGEPTYDFLQLFSTGAINQFSVVDVLGDTTFIDYTGLRSFNAVLQLRNEGRNSPFSAKVQSMLPETFQPFAEACAINFDNYALFSIDSIYGPAVLVFDTLLTQWVSLDIYEGIAKISQFAQVRTSGMRFLAFRTTDNNIYIHYQGETVEQASVLFGQWGPPSPNSTLMYRHWIACFTNIMERGLVKFTPYVDDIALTLQQASIVRASAVVPALQPIPFTSFVDSVERVVMEVDTEKAGYKCGVLVQWDFQAELLNFALTLGVDTSRISEDRGEAISLAGNLTITSISNGTFELNELFRIYGIGFSSVSMIQVGDINLPWFQVESDTVIKASAGAVAVTGYLKVLTSTNEFEYENTPIEIG